MLKKIRFKQLFYTNFSIGILFLLMTFLYLGLSYNYFVINSKTLPELYKKLMIFIPTVFFLISSLFFILNNKKKKIRSIYFKTVSINIIIILLIIMILELIFGNWIFSNKINQLNINKNISLNLSLMNFTHLKSPRLSIRDCITWPVSKCG